MKIKRMWRTLLLSAFLILALSVPVWATEASSCLQWSNETSPPSVTLTAADNNNPRLTASWNHTLTDGNCELEDAQVYHVVVSDDGRRSWMLLDWPGFSDTGDWFTYLDNKEPDDGIVWTDRIYGPNSVTFAVDPFRGYHVAVRAFQQAIDGDRAEASGGWSGAAYYGPTRTDRHNSVGMGNRHLPAISQTCTVQAPAGGTAETCAVGIHTGNHAAGYVLSTIKLYMARGDMTDTGRAFVADALSVTLTPTGGSAITLERITAAPESGGTHMYGCVDNPANNINKCALTSNTDYVLKLAATKAKVVYQWKLAGDGYQYMWGEPGTRSSWTLGDTHSATGTDSSGVPLLELAAIKR